MPSKPPTVKKQGGPADPDGGLDISIAPVRDQAALAERWRALEAVADGGFFRGWTYLGTLLPHMASPHLLSVRSDGLDVALGLFNRTPGPWPRLMLHATGDPAWDRLYVEHNGLLLRPGAELLLRYALAAALARGTLVLPGIDDVHLRAARTAGGTFHLRATHWAPAVDLTALPAGDHAVLHGLSANTRAQIRRARRLYGAELRIERVAGLADALDAFDRMAALHQAAWIARGKKGAFADRRIRDFHAALIATGLPRGEIALLRVSAGAREIGILYNFQHGGRMLAYQSGFAPEDDARLKPGLVCHTLAMEAAREGGLAVYDFLAGAQRYKTSLAPQGGEKLHWVTLYRQGSLPARWQGIKQALRRGAWHRPVAASSIE